VDSTVEVLELEGAGGLSVSAVMRRTGASRTTFYRHFDDVYGVVAEILQRVGAELLTSAGDWLNDPQALGRPEVVYPNLLGYARSFDAHGRLLAALSDASVIDEGIRRLWDGLIEEFVEITADAIRRDQAVGTVRADLDAEAVALVLTLMGERVSVQMLGRERKCDPEAYAAMLTPIWIGTLFGVVPQDDRAAPRE